MTGNDAVACPGRTRSPAIKIAALGVSCKRITARCHSPMRLAPVGARFPYNTCRRTGFLAGKFGCPNSPLSLSSRAHNPQPVSAMKPRMRAARASDCARSSSAGKNSITRGTTFRTANGPRAAGADAEFPDLSVHAACGRHPLTPETGQASFSSFPEIHQSHTSITRLYANCKYKNAAVRKNSTVPPTIRPVRIGMIFAAASPVMTTWGRSSH